MDVSTQCPSKRISKWNWNFYLASTLITLQCLVFSTVRSQLQSEISQSVPIPTANWPTTVYIKKRPSSIEINDRRTRQLNSLSTTNLQAAGTSDYGYGVSGGSEYGNYAAAGSHGGYGHGGGGHGHGHGGGYGKGQVNSSAVGLLGFLALLSLIQNVLRQMTTTAAPMMGRRKRDAAASEDEQKTVDVDQITRLMMPLLMRVAQVKDGIISPQCVLPETCRANEVLVKKLGPEGRSLGTMISESIVKMIKDVDTSGSAGKQIDTAARTGRSGLDCGKLYKECPNLPPTDPSLYTYLIQGQHV